MKNKKGFTLVELIAVLAVLAVLVLVALPNVLGVFNKSIEEVMKIEETQATDAGSLYVRDHCGRTAKSKVDRSACRNHAISKKIEGKVYFCLSEIRKKGYIDEIKYKGNTKCDGIVLYDYDEEEVKFSEGKTYLICDNDLYVTPELAKKEEAVIKAYKEIINDCPNSSYEETPEPEPNPNPEPTPAPTNSIYTVTLDNAGGTSTGNNQIYLKYGEGWYSDSEGVNSIDVVNIPVKTGNEFKGYYTGQNGTGTKVIDENGLIQAGEEKVFNANGTLYANWIASTYKLTLDNAGATTPGTEALYEKYGIGWYSEQAGTNSLTSIVVPVKKGYTFNGYNLNGTKIIKDTGEINNNTRVINTDTETTASYTPRTYSVILNNDGADTPGTPAIYLKYNTGWYDDINATNSISKITIPKKAGYTFNGYYTDEAGEGTQVIDKNGNIKNGNTTIFSNEVGQAMLHAKWKFLFKEFDFTGDVQIFTVPVSGNYKVEVWGAQGGSYIDDYYGGYGGYSKGDIYLPKDEILYIYVGGEGKLATWTNKGDVSASGGYNGGGNVRLSYPNNNWDSYFIRYGGSGGGATHIATSKGLLSTLINKKNDILIVAGGGGGYGGYYVNNKMNNFSSQGHGGGFKGVTSNSNYGAIGGTQTIAGYSAYDNSKGVASFGQGGSSRTSGFYVLGGAGGGGFFGGGAVDESASDNGAGGSGYIGNSKLKNKAMYCYDCEESNEVDTKTISINVSGYHQTSKANVGNGFAMITYIEE